MMFSYVAIVAFMTIMSALTIVIVSIILMRKSHSEADALKAEMKLYPSDNFDDSNM